MNRVPFLMYLLLAALLAGCQKRAEEGHDAESVAREGRVRHPATTGAAARPVSALGVRG